MCVWGGEGVGVIEPKIASCGPATPGLRVCVCVPSWIPWTPLGISILAADNSSRNLIYQGLMCLNEKAEQRLSYVTLNYYKLSWNTPGDACSLLLKEWKVLTGR